MTLEPRTALKLASAKHRRGGISQKRIKYPVVPGLSLCQAHKVTAATEKDYTEVFGEVQDFSARLPNFTWDSASSVDLMLVKLFDDRLLDGDHAAGSG